MKIKGLSRIDNKERGMRGWYARIRRGGQERRKWFSDKSQGGRRKAQDAAIAWLEAQAKELGLPWTGEVVVTRSRAGRKIIGVRRIMKAGRQVWEATFQFRGKVHRTSFSIEKHGSREARRLAIQARERWERAAFGASVDR